MSQLIVPRALSKLPPFEIINTSGIISDTAVYTFYSNSILRPSNLNICPYTDFIPFHYLQNGYNNDVRNIAAINALSGDPRSARKQVNKYLFYNTMENFGMRYTSRTDIENIRPIFRGNAGCRRYGSPFNSYTITQFAVYAHQNGNLFPAVLLAIPRENWLLCKMELLKTGRVDLSRCILFIDQELDTTRYHNQGLRKIIRQEILPFVNDLKVTAAKVPLSYILEKCFLSEFKFQTTNIFERRKEEEEVKKYLLSLVRQRLGGSFESSHILGEGVITTNEGEWVISAGTSSANPESGTIQLVDTDTYTWGQTQSYTVTNDNLATGYVSTPTYIAGVDPVEEEYQEEIESEQGDEE